MKEYVVEFIVCVSAVDREDAVLAAEIQLADGNYQVQTVEEIEQ